MQESLFSLLGDVILNAIKYILSGTSNTAGTVIVCGMRIYLAMFVTNGLLAVLRMGGRRFLRMPFRLLSRRISKIFTPTNTPSGTISAKPSPPAVATPASVVTDPVKILAAGDAGALKGFSTPDRARSATPSIVSEEGAPEIPAPRGH